MMKRVWLIFTQMMQQISRDMMLLLLCIAPILAGTFFRFGIPAIEQILCEYFHQSRIIVPYYFLCDWLLALLPGIMFAFVGGLVTLGEIDDKIAGYMALTPAGSKGYLLGRLGIPALFSVAFSYGVVTIFGLSQMQMVNQLILCITSSLQGILTAMLVVGISSNKVEGMAVGKLAGLICIGMFVPILFHTPMQYAAGILPSFWIGRFLLGGHPGNVLGFCIVFAVWMYFVYEKYQRKVSI